MGVFDERLRGEEARFVARQRRDFTLRNRRNELFATWVARDLLALPAQAVPAYAAAIVACDLDEPGDGDVLRQVASDLEAHGVAASPETLARRLQDCAGEAAREAD